MKPKSLTLKALKPKALKLKALKLKALQLVVRPIPGWSVAQVVCGCLQAAKWLKDTVALGSIGSFEQQLRLVRTLQQLLALATAVSAGSACDAKRLAKLGGASSIP